ncbi:MAG: 50S ribosomal protein L23 [Planctomycetota bacterium]
MKIADPRQVVIRPIITEKTEKSQKFQNVYVFQVADNANKLEIKDAVEKIWSVTVLKVRVLRNKGKIRRVRYKRGKTPEWKKAIVSLQKGQTIDIY